MVYDYLITLKRPDYKMVDQVSQIMYVFSILAFAYYYYQLPKGGVIYLILAIAVVACWVFTLIKKRRSGQAFFRLGLIIASVGWFVGPFSNIWMGILYAAAALLEKQVKFPQEIGFTDAEISFNTLPKRTLKWNEINNVVIKDGLITIDQKDNKLFQKEIEGYVTADIETEFNQFCRNCLSKTNTANPIS